MTLPGRPPSWNDSYRIVRKSTTRNGAQHYFHTLAKTEKLVRWQEDMVLITRASKPSAWDPPGWVYVYWTVRLERHIDMDNLQKAVNDVLEMATGVDDKWFLPVFEIPRVGVPRKEAGIDLFIAPLPDHRGRGVEEVARGAFHLAGNLALKDT